MTAAPGPAATHRSRFPLWVAIVAGGTITSISLGVRSTFGILLEPIADGLDTQTGSIAIAVAVQNLLWGFSQPIAGAASDRFGAARTLAAGGVLYVLSMLLLSRASSPTMVLLSGGFITGVAIGAASFAVVLSTVGKMSPPEKRSLNLGIVSAVGSLGQFVLVPAPCVLLLISPTANAFCQIFRTIRLVSMLDFSALRCRRISISYFF